MATSGFLKVDKASLKTIAMKESPFDASGFPTHLYGAYSYLLNPSRATRVATSQPQLNSTIGVSLKGYANYGGFTERPANTRGYYFPLDSNLYGYNLALVQSEPMKPVDERVPNIEGALLAGYENNGLSLYEGMAASKTDITNLIDSSTFKNSWVNANVSTFSHTPVNSTDGISILPSNMSLDTKRSFTFTPATTGTYHFSFYARLLGDARLYSSTSVRALTVTVSPAPASSYEVVIPRLLRSANTYNLEFEWNRYGRAINLTAGTTYTVTLNWYASSNWRRADAPLKMCGILLEKSNYLTPYDVRGTNIDGSGRAVTAVRRPLLFNLEKFDNALITPAKSWMITYLRKFSTNAQASNPTFHSDNLYPKNCGYSGAGLMPSIQGEQASDYYNYWEKVIFYHEANASQVKYEVFNTETNKHYSSMLSNFSAVESNTIGGVRYNLCLGITVINRELQECDNAFYRDLLYIPEVTAEEYNAEISKFFEVETANMTYEKTGETPVTVSGALTIKKTNLLERSTLEY